MPGHTGAPEPVPFGAMVITSEEMLLRLGTSIVLGAAIGYEREHAGRPAGLRTHLLVSMAAATFMLVSTQFVFFQPYGRDDLVVVDTSRIAASVVTGVGFLGAGAIMRTGLGVQGLTTAASLWMMASIGLASGAGMYLVAVLATVSGLLCLGFLRRSEAKTKWRTLRRRVEVVVEGTADRVAALIDLLGEHGVAVTDVDQDRNLQSNRTRLSADVRVASGDALTALLDALEAEAGVQRVKVQRPG